MFLKFLFPKMASFSALSCPCRPSYQNYATNFWCYSILFSPIYSTAKQWAKSPPAAYLTGFRRWKAVGLYLHSNRAAFHTRLFRDSACNYFFLWTHSQYLHKSAGAPFNFLHFRLCLVRAKGMLCAIVKEKTIYALPMTSLLSTQILSSTYMFPHSGRQLWAINMHSQSTNYNWFSTKLCNCLY